MKYLIILIYSLISVYSFSQNQNIDAQRVLVRSNFRPPVLDTTTSAVFDKEWRIRPQDGITYQYDIFSSGPKWKPISGSGGDGLQNISSLGGYHPITKGLNGKIAEFKSIYTPWGLQAIDNTNYLSLQPDTTSNGLSTNFKVNKIRDSLAAITTTKVNTSDLPTILSPYFLTPNGTSSQYVRGDGTLATLPVLGDTTGITTGEQIFIASGGQTNFTPSVVLPSDLSRITVTRNGVNIPFSKSTNTIIIVDCDAGDIVKIRWII